jgi:hypothetical protein
MDYDEDQDLVDMEEEEEEEEGGPHQGGGDDFGGDGMMDGDNSEDIPVTQEDAWAVIRYVLTS